MTGDKSPDYEQDLSLLSMLMEYLRNAAKRCEMLRKNRPRLCYYRSRVPMAQPLN